MLTAPPTSEPLLDLFDLVALEDVLLLEVVEAVEADAALEALEDLAGVVLEALQAADLPLPDHGTVAQQADLAVAQDLALGDVGPGHGRTLDLEYLPDLGLAVQLLDERRGKQPLH